MHSFLRGFLRPLAPLSATAALLVSASASADEAPRAAATTTRIAAPASKADAAATPPPIADDKATPAWDSARATHRSGFVVGVAAGFGVMAFSGFPNDAREIGLQRYYTETGASLGTMSALWFGGALADWFTFGIGFSTGSMPLLSAQKASSGGLIFHMEAYPLFALGGRYRDLGAMFDAGTGSALVTPKDSEKKLIDGGSASQIGAGAFYEGFKGWKIKHGPFVEGSYVWSDSVRRPAVFFGWRAALYTGI
jgi:hypothetical protein